MYKSKDQVQEILNEFNVPDFFRKYKKSDEDKKIEVLKKLYNTTSKGVENVLNSNSKNLKEIESSRGDFSKYKGYDDYTKIKSFLDRREGSVNRLPKDYIEMRNLITKGESLLEKEANAFKKSFSNNNRIVQSIYISLVSALTLSILKMFTKYYKYNNSGNGWDFEFVDDNLNLSNGTEANAIRSIHKSYTSGELSKLIRINDMESELTEDNILTDVMNGINLLIKDGFKYKKAGAFITIITAVVATLISSRFILIKFLSLRIHLSKGLEESARVIEETADNLNNEKMKEKQVRYAEFFRKLADRVDLDDSVAENKARSNASKSDKEIEKDLDQIDFDL